jgi:nitroreductase
MLREFDPDKRVPEKTIRELLRNARRAPSAAYAGLVNWPYSIQ